LLTRKLYYYVLHVKNMLFTSLQFDLKPRKQEGSRMQDLNKSVNLESKCAKIKTTPLEESVN